MIPFNKDEILSGEFEIEQLSGQNYKMNIDKKIVNGYCDGLEAMKQVIYKILNTERYQYQIYSEDYGVELLDLYGQPFTFVYPEIKRRITEALVQDDRVESVDDFEFDTTKKAVKVTFTVHTVYGDIDAERTVNY